MKAEDLKLEELVEFADGKVNLHGRRLVLHDLRAFGQFRRDVLETTSPANGHRILTRFGYFWGQADAAAMKRLFTWDSLEELLKAGSRLHTIQGVARSFVQEVKTGEDGSPFHMELVWHESGEAEEHLTEAGPSPEPVCWTLAGYASGYASFCLDRKIVFLERACRACGDLACAAEGREEAAWGDRLQGEPPYHDSANEILDKVSRLTAMLKEKDRQLAQQQQRLERLSGRPPALPVEVRSAVYRRIVDMATRVAPFDTSVLITGESGVGKEVLARHIHRLSARAAGPIIAVNCGALPETLLEGELFGYRAGSFTGATRDRVGLFEEAQNGTLFLDEIGDIPLSTQMKLLRVLQEREVVRLGENRPRPIDVRVIAATNRDLPRHVREGGFREDLYYRLGVVELRIPPLRERREDILPFARYFVQRFARKLGLPRLRLDASTLAYLQNHDWPGNVRELENAIERAAVFSRDGLILPGSLPPAVLHPLPSEAIRPSGSGGRLEDAERTQILAAVQATGGHRRRAAAALGISPATLWRKLKQYGVAPEK